MVEKTFTTGDVQTSKSNHNLSTLCWSITAIVLSFFCLTHLIVLLCFSIGWAVSPIVAPVALIHSLLIGDWLIRREGIQGLQRIIPPITVLSIFALSLILAALFFDMSWDGLWYHQTAIYQMANGWNPLHDAMHAFTPHLQSWVRYYAKGPWYIALALFKTTGHIEWAKVAPLMAFATSFLAVFAACLDFGMRRRMAAIIAALVSLNPVVMCQLTSYLVDGLLISFFACFVAATIRWFKRPGFLVTIIVILSAILCINTKLTGLVYLCFFVAAGGLYLLIRQRNLLWRYIAVQLVSILIGITVFGFNPYITNTVHQDNPFYPWLGTATNPGFSESGPNRDPVERYETPHNMLGRNRFIRFGYAIFGRPGSQPFFQGENARLMWPFDIGWKDFHIFYFHEVRISGFGPLFSGAFLIALIVLVFSIVHPGIPRLIQILFIGTIVLSLLISKHAWWARYGPQLWWLPIFAVFAGFTVPNWRVVRWAAAVLAAILLINVVLLTAAHFRWEIESTRTTHQQMALLSQQGDVEIDFQYFYEPFSERLKSAGVMFRAVRDLQCDQPMELMSVCPGYPGAIRACIDKNE